MAKISARGAKEVGRVNVVHPGNSGIEPFKVTFLMTSDGRILRKTEGSGYTVAKRVADPQSRTQYALESYVRRLGYEVP